MSIKKETNYTVEEMIYLRNKLGFITEEQRDNELIASSFYNALNKKGNARKVNGLISNYRNAFMCEMNEVSNVISGR